MKVEYYRGDGNGPDEAYFLKDEFPAVPRVGDSVDFDRFPMARVDQVVWTPDAGEQDVVIIVKMDDD